ncbi:oocyte zinc finger protein XlCOF6 [Plutella xylostella]|uniref:oocyte zinc finger protein XlCOF6 n=1 Tax=Plutella xylostella TaxID=51655 RepID=UPI0020324BC8|nr:oocyte zinc finger protein XlCOF6 [Plutella xylostella]
MDMWAGLCRCCLTSNCDIIITGGEDNIKQKFLDITSIEVKPEDNLPQNICASCYELLNLAHNFRVDAIKMNNELRLQLEKLLQNAEDGVNIRTSIEEDDDIDFANDPIKQLEAIIKTEPNDSDDEYYYVLVVDPKESEGEKLKTETQEKELPIEAYKIKQEHIDPEELIQDEPEPEPENNSFEASIESFIISNKVPVNVPATILENEEESQDTDNDHFNNVMDIDQHTETNSQEPAFANIIEDSQDKSNDSQIETIDASSLIQGLPNSQNNFVKILTSTRADGTIVLKSGDNITYLTDSQYVTNGDEDDDDLSQGEVILCEGDDSSQFQILKCDGNELVIEYDDDGQIATVMQQEDGSFLCDCGESFEDLGDYEKHQATHNQLDEHLCTLCGKNFESAEILAGHVALHNVQGPHVPCPFCSQLIRRHMLTQHIKYSHTRVKPRCNECLKTFANPNNLKRHMMIHNGVREFECDICFKRFHQKITMQTHRLTHVNPLACHQCDQVFTAPADLEDHRESNQCNKSKIVKVKEELMKTVKQEVTTNAGKLVGYACSLCQKMFSVESALEQHVENLHMVNPMELLCSQCGEVLPSRREMATHQLTHKILKSKSAKRYECSSCGKGCTSQAMLIMHERVHTNERPFSCHLCTLRFKTKTHLRTHQLTHTREKKFGCSVCMKFFALKGNLVVHLRTHTGERPYICSLCGDAFIDSKYLKKHKLKKHSIENVPWNQY